MRETRFRSTRVCDRIGCCVSHVLREGNRFPLGCASVGLCGDSSGKIDFLKGYNVWRVSFDEMRNLLEIFSDAVRTVKPLVDEQAPSMRDIKTHDTELLSGFADCWLIFE